jgi:hypothetical protein
MRTVLFLTLALLLAACKQEAAVPPKEIWQNQPGDVQVLNSCGVTGAAAQMGSYLRSRGFNVVMEGNDPEWSNYPETVIALRDPDWPGKPALARALKTENFIPLQNKNEVFHATIFVGRDFQRIIHE